MVAPNANGVMKNTVTVAQNEDPQRLQEIAAEFDRAARRALPISANVSEIVLLDNETGRWRVRHRFALP